MTSRPLSKCNPWQARGLREAEATHVPQLGRKLSILSFAPARNSSISKPGQLRSLLITTAQNPTRELSNKGSCRSSSSLQKLRAAEKPNGTILRSYEKELSRAESIRVSCDGSLHIASTKEEKAKIKNASEFFRHPCKFLYSAGAPGDHRFNSLTPEVVVLGASNVGKSSFLNALMREPGIARVSQRPGFTTVMNAYGVGPRPNLSTSIALDGETLPKHSLILMDTPGYGFKSQSDWGKAIMKYIETRKMLRGAILLISSEKRLLNQDKWMIRSLAQSKTPTAVVLTKADKSKSMWRDKCTELAQAVRDELLQAKKDVEDSTVPDHETGNSVLVSAANIGGRYQGESSGGIGGARAEILRISGLGLQRDIEPGAASISYDGPVIPFNDIQWK